MNVVWGALAAVVAFLMLLGAAVRGVWRAAMSVQEWVGALKANTEATQSLSGDLKNLSMTTSKTLTEHGTTLTEHETTLVEHGERLGRLEHGTTVTDHGERLDNLEHPLSRHVT